MGIWFNLTPVESLIPSMSGEGNVWVEGPTNTGIIVYSVIVPAICFLGICGNLLSFMVLMRKELKGSIYVYLAVLAMTDLCTCVVMFLSGLSRGILFIDDWPILDAVYGIPVSGVLNCMSVSATMGVTVDRALYLKNPLSCEKPKFCRVSVARRVMIVSFVLAIVVNLPYCFIFDWEGDTLVTTPFYYSKYYALHTMFRFVFFGVIPSILLTAGNSYLIFVLRKLKKLRSKCSTLKNKKTRDYTNLTATLILIIFFFLITEIPCLMVSRDSAVMFFFNDRPGDGCNSKSLEAMREVFTVINATSLAVDFLLYYLLCPTFSRVLTRICRRDKSRKSIQMNVFVINDKPNSCKNFDERVRSLKKLTMEMMKQKEDSYPSTLDDAYCDPEEEVAMKRQTMITLCSMASNV